LDGGKGGYQLTAAWQAGLSNAAGAGAFFGVLANGILVARFGMKKTLLGSLIILTAFLSLTFSARNLPMLLAGEILCGLPWGVFATTAPAYASEVLPLNLRVYLTSYTNMCFVIGQLFAAGVLAGLVNVPNQWSYRIPFALQWTWPVVLFPILLFAPESPWHLVRHNKLEEAEKSIRRLQRKSAPIDPMDTLSNIVHTNKLEQEMAVGTSYLDCFKGTELRRTEVACFAFLGQVLSGSAFAYNSTYFFSQIGLSSNITYNLNVGGTALALLGCLASWLLFMPYFGRRTIYTIGMAIETLILGLIGFLQIHPTKSVSYGQAVLTMVWTFFFQASMGQLGWALPAEVGSTRLRQKTICLARNAYYIANVIGAVLEQYMVNPEAWNLSGYTGFVWAGTALLMTFWAFFRLPETKDRTYEELTILFAQRIPARKFASTQVDAFNEKQNAELTARAQSVSAEGQMRNRNRSVASYVQRIGDRF
jgi:SP family general alpha glucoside:H+ symporter-like MFS transporter